MATDAEDGLFRYRAELVRLLDADSLQVRLDGGFGIRFECAIRIAGVDAPERNTPEGFAAAVALLRLIEASADRWPLRVQTFRTAAGTEARSFARWVGSCSVVMAEGPVDVAAWLLDQGLAVPA